MATEIEQAALAMVRAQRLSFGPADQWVQIVLGDESYIQNPPRELTEDVLDLLPSQRVAGVHPMALDLCGATVRLVWDVVAYRRTSQRQSQDTEESIAYRMQHRAEELTRGMVRFVKAIEDAYAMEMERIESR